MPIKSNIVRVRIAPSPTGSFHIGHARTALFNLLFARKHQGIFIVRIEDTDKARSQKKFEEDIFSSLEWLNLIPDEGPRSGGRYGPYRQSERAAYYRETLEKLLKEGHAFWCFHTESEVEAEQSTFSQRKKNIAHRCSFRDLSPSEQKKMQAEKKEAIIRFKTPPGRTIDFIDLIRGPINFDSDLLGDFSIARDLTSVLYNLAVVVDDSAMAITHVIRGEDHIPNTPKQILLQEVLGLTTPQYAHLPLILGSGRAKLSSRHGALGIEEYRKQGYLPEALVNFIALLGWNPGDDQEILIITELIQKFELSKVQKAGAIFDSAKLRWMNSLYIKKLPSQKLGMLVEPILEEKGLIEKKPGEPLRSKDGRILPLNYLNGICNIMRERLETLIDVVDLVDFFFQKPRYEKRLLFWQDMTEPELIKSLENILKVLSSLAQPWLAPQINHILLREAEKFSYQLRGKGDKGFLLWPLRVALSGKEASPGPIEIMEILGKEESENRIKKALSLIMTPL